MLTKRIYTLLQRGGGGNRLVFVTREVMGLPSYIVQICGTAALLTVKSEGDELERRIPQADIKPGCHTARPNSCYIKHFGHGHFFHTWRLGIIWSQ